MKELCETIPTDHAVSTWNFKPETKKNMKLWEKGIPTDKQIEHFTVGTTENWIWFLQNTML
jgi:hypothetical protein